MAEAEAAAARREARRRRILDSSHERLQRITGKLVPPPACPAPAPRPASPVFAETPLTFESALLPDVMKPLHEGSVHQQDTSQLIPEQVENNIPELGDFLRSLSAPHEPGNTREPPPSAWERVSASKLDIIAISLLVQVVFSVFSLSAETASIFLPLLVYVVTKLVMLPRRGQGGLVNAVLVMNGVAPDKVQTIMLVSHLLSTFMQDVFIYLFVIVCVQSLFVYFFVKNIPQAL